MLCFGFIAVASYFYKKHKKYLFDYVVECVSSNEKMGVAIGCALDDFANVRKFSGSVPGYHQII